MSMLKQSLAEKLTYSLKIISLGLILGLGIQFAEAWTAPTLSPPSGTISGPITNGNVPQYKTGMLGVNSVTTPINALEVGLGGNVLVGGGVYTAGSINATSGTVTGVLTAGKVQIVDVVVENTNCAPMGLVARDSNGVLLSCQGPGDLKWKKASGGGGGGEGERRWYSLSASDVFVDTFNTYGHDIEVKVRSYGISADQCVVLVGTPYVTASICVLNGGAGMVCECSATVPAGERYYLWTMGFNSGAILR